MSNKRPPPDYESHVLDLWLENASVVPSLLSESDIHLLKKIETYSDHFKYTSTEIVEKIRNDPMFAAHFAKEPRRQGVHEKLASKWLDEIECVSNFQVLPKSGANALYVDSDGEVRKILQNPKSKSLDFMWTTGKTTCYAMHKYTKQSGGDQDNQFKEMEALLRRFFECRDESCILIVIVDGPYYTDNKMASLQTITRTHPPKSYAVHIENVPQILEEYI